MKTVPLAPISLIFLLCACNMTVDLPTGPAVRKIVAGSQQTCALTMEGGVQCWGMSTARQLVGGHRESRIPVQVEVAGVASVAAGHAHTCALTTRQRVRCWGRNDAGQLGDGTTTHSRAPVDVLDLPDGITSIAGGFAHSCATTVAGAVWCWGNNNGGQLGRGSIDNTLKPALVMSLPAPIVVVAAGGAHTCGLSPDGRVFCWGFNQDGQLGNGLGNGMNHSVTLPVAVVGLPDRAMAIATGSDHTCAVTQGGAVYCWGSNRSGILGNGSQVDAYQPTLVVGLDHDVVQIAASESHTCALQRTGAMFCWGSNVNNGFGNVDVTKSSRPVAVRELKRPAVAIATGYESTCALSADGEVQCWGRHRLDRMDASLEADARMEAQTVLSDVASLSAGEEHACAVTRSQQLFCWGRDDGAQLGQDLQSFPQHPWTVPTLDSDIVDISVGPRHSCAVTKSGAVKCWGQNAYGQLGDNTDRGSERPVLTAPIGGPAKTVATGFGHSCALLHSGRVACWGDNAHGQLGMPGKTTASSHQPVAVAGLPEHIVALQAGWTFNCALTAEGSVWCWGGNDRSQLGRGNARAASPRGPIPAPVVGLDDATSIALGAFHACATTRRGVLLCWGDNWNHKLGYDAEFESPVPSIVPGLRDAVVAAAAGVDNTCAVTRQGAVYCWGGAPPRNNHTQQVVYASTPSLIPMLESGVDAVHLGDGHACAHFASGQHYCWGDNSAGQVGPAQERTLPQEAGHQ